MVRLITALWLLLLPNFTSSNDYSLLSSRGKDGYRFETKEWEMTEFTVKVYLAKNRDQMNAWRRDAGIPKPRKMPTSVGFQRKTVAAFSKIRFNDKECDIYIYDPEYVYEPEFVGHELYHCVYGRWHTKQK